MIESEKQERQIHHNMPLNYKISEELNMILYVGQGVLSPSDFYALEKIVVVEKSRKPDMITLVDALDVSTSFSWADVHNFINHLEFMAKNKSGPYIMLTMDQGIHLLAQAANLVTDKAELKIHVHYTLEDFIRAFGLTDHRDEITPFWQEYKAEFSTQPVV